MKTTFQRIIDVNQAYDKRDTDPSKNYGIHGAELRLVLKTGQGAVQFLLFTNMHLPHVAEELLWKREVPVTDKIRQQFQEFCKPVAEDKVIETVIEYNRFLNRLELDQDYLFRPMGADLGYHSPNPMYDGHEPIRHTLVKMEFNRETDEFKPPIYGDPVICPYLDGDLPCYYDGSGLNGQRVADILFRDGEEAVWAKLESYYKATFEE